MATHEMNGRKNDPEFSSKIEELRMTMRSLLQEAAGRTPPLDIDPETGTDFYEDVARFETQLIELALQMSGGRQSKAARLLHIPTSTLNWKMKKLHIR